MISILRWYLHSNSEQTQAPSLDWPKIRSKGAAPSQTADILQNSIGQLMNFLLTQYLIKID